MKTIYLIRHSKKEDIRISDNDPNRQKIDEENKLSEEGIELANKLSKTDLLKNVDEVWASNYKRSQETAKILFKDKKINISSSFDERHYGIFTKEKNIFWVEQFTNPNLKNVNGESQLDVRKRMEDKINEILDNNSKEIAIVSHNAAILFYLLKVCKLIKAEYPKKLTISYKDKILINEGIMASPSIMKVIYDNKKIIDIKYIK